MSPTDASAAPASAPPSNGLGLGTFMGVYTPTVLTILGVILYLKMGEVVSNGGVWGTMGIVLLANAITGVTALSMSALATNMRVGVGGAYYIISRSLGLELGGALGIPLFLSQALSVTLYAYGLAVTVQKLVWPDAPVQLIAAGIVIAVTLLAARSTVLALKAQLPILGLIVLSLGSLLFRLDFGGGLQIPALPTWETADFWPMFALFFPAVTGVLAGVGLSGDLKNPGRSIPTGVGLAVVTGFVVYISMPWLLAHAGTASELRAEDIWITTGTDSAGLKLLGWLVVPGLVGAILSSAIGSILGAPRTLQALATDGLMPKRLAKLDEKTGEPMLALRISGGVALAAVALGDLNLVASVVSMFFLTTYGMLNLAAALEEIVRDPHYRPRIRAPFWLALLGAVGCFVAMAAINPVAFGVAVLVEFGIWWALSRRTLEVAWGDLRTGLWYAMARFAMLRLRNAHIDARNWRPHILVFSDDLESDLSMVEMANHFSADRGIVTVATLLVNGTQAQASRQAQYYTDLVAQRGLEIFPEVHTVAELEAGMATTVQANGFGGIDSNMVCFGWPKGGKTSLATLLARVRYMADIEKSCMIMRPVRGSRENSEGELLVWWKGKESNGDLMLLLAHMLSMTDDWRGSHITLATVVGSEPEAVDIKARTEASLAESRIAVTVETIVSHPNDSVAQLIQQRSATAALTFLGLPRVEPGMEEEVSDSMTALMEGLPSVILVRNAGPFRGRLL